MKHSGKILLTLLFLTGLEFALSGCVTDAYVGTGVYYGHRDPWFHDGPWMDGHRGYYDRGPRGGGRADVYISPPRLPTPPGLPRL